MENPNTNQLFKEDEIAYIRRWDKERNDYVSIPFPKIGGRLRLAHEDNQALSIETEIVRYDDQTAVVCAVAKTAKGSFKGIGMASVQRDEKIAPAILELAETRAIARALRFAGYGVEYCSAEEVSHLGNGNERPGHSKPNDNLPAGGNRNGASSPQRGKVSGNGHNRPQRSDGNGNGGGNGNGRLTSKQYRFLLQLNEEQGRSKADLDKQSLEMFGSVAQYLSKSDASAFIEQLLSR
jgi:hypothetical protein